MKKLLYICSLFLIVSCATRQQPVRKSYFEDICGKHVLVVENGQKEVCKTDNADGCVRFEDNKWTMAYNTNSVEVINHEKEHMCGMTHKEPWVSIGKEVFCTEVVKPGKSNWQANDVMCRAPEGYIYKNNDFKEIKKTKFIQNKIDAVDTMQGVL